MGGYSKDGRGHPTGRGHSIGRGYPTGRGHPTHIGRRGNNQKDSRMRDKLLKNFDHPVFRRCPKS